jgi:hypothetical protein
MTADGSPGTANQIIRQPMISGIENATTHGFRRPAASAIEPRMGEKTAMTTPAAARVHAQADCASAPE